MKTTKRLFALALSLLMVFLLALPVFAADEAASAADIAALMEKMKLTGGTYHKNGSAEPTDLKIDEQGRLVATAGGTGGNLHLFADLGALKGILTEYTVEVKVTGIDVADNWHYGFGINNKVDNAMKTYFTVRSGAYTEGQNYGQLKCSLNGNSEINSSKAGAPNSDFASMSAALNVENVLSVTVSKTAGTVVYKFNGVTAATQVIGNTTPDLTLQDVCFITPYTKTVAYTSLRILDGEGNVAYELTFTEKSGVPEGLENDALMQFFHMTSGKFHKNAIEAPQSVKMDDQGRFVVEAGGTGGNIHVYPDLGGVAGNLTEYTVEVKLAGIDVTDNWHYGFGINNKADNAMKTYFTVRSGAYTEGQNYGQLKCSLNGNSEINSSKAGAPNTDFANMSAALNVENVLSITVSKTAGTVVYKFNGVTAATQIIGNTTPDLTLQDVCLIVPYTKTVAFSYIRIYDKDNQLAFEQNFSGKSESEGVKHKVTVNYVYENGDKAAESVTQEVAENAYFAIDSAPIEGYYVEAAKGKMGTEDLTVTVTYKKIYTVTIHYVKADGSTVMEDYVIGNLVNGDTYSADSLPLANYTVDQELVTGTVNGANVEVTVTYSPVKYSLTIKYQYADGTSAAEDYTAEVEYGDGYSVDSPVVEGYTPNKVTVSAKQIKKNTEIVVIYNANAAETDTAGDTSETPNDKTEGGCGSAIGAMAILPMLIGIAVVGLRKKEN